MLVVFLLSFAALVAALAVAVRAALARRAETIVAVTIVWVALITVPIYALGLANVLTRGALGITSLALSLATYGAASFRAGPGFARKLWPTAVSCLELPLDGFALAFREHSLMLLPLVLCTGTFFVNIIGAYFLPAWGGWDGIWYHEPIIGFTIQNHGFHPVDLAIDTTQKINGYPRLLEMLGLWFGIFSGRQLIELPNSLLMPGLVCAVYATGRQHSSNRLACMGWACAFAITPGYFEFIRTVYVDNALATFVLAGLLFCVHRPLQFRHALLASVALALACNTKVFGVFATVPLAVITGSRLLATHRMRAVPTVLLGTSIIVVFSAGTYLRNLHHFHNPVWPDLKVDVPALGIHWPGLLSWGNDSTQTPQSQVNLRAPLSVLLNDLASAPLTVTDRSHKYCYKYGVGMIWVGIPLFLLSSLLFALRGARRTIGLASKWTMPDWFAKRGRSSSPDPAAADAAAIIAMLICCYWTTTEQYTPRYNLGSLGAGIALSCWLLQNPKWIKLQEGVIFIVAAGAMMGLWWDRHSHPLVGPDRFLEAVATPYPEREVTPEFGAAVKKDVGLARERELVAGTTILEDDFIFPAILWNNDYTNTVVPMRRGGDVVAEAERVNATWVYASDDTASRKLAATNKWEKVGTLYTEGWGTAWRRRPSSR